jgi:rubrerythrin
MKEQDLIKEINKVIALESGHLGMYKNYRQFKDIELRRTFRRFMEIELEHIRKLKDIEKNLGKVPSVLAESGDIIGKIFGISVTNLASQEKLLRAYSFIEKKSYEGYYELVSKLELSDDKLNRFIAEVISDNMLEAKLMHLWLEEKLEEHKFSH